MNDTQEQPGALAMARFGDRLKQARKAGGVTQAELARRMRERGHQFVQQTIVKIERGDGERIARITEAADLAASLGVPLGELLRDQEGEDR